MVKFIDDIERINLNKNSNILKINGDGSLILPKGRQDQRPESNTLSGNNVATSNTTNDVKVNQNVTFDINESNRSWIVGSTILKVQAKDVINDTVFMQGRVVSYDSQGQTVTINVLRKRGNGTFSQWEITPVNVGLLEFGSARYNMDDNSVEFFVKLPEPPDEPSKLPKEGIDRQENSWGTWIKLSGMVGESSFILRSGDTMYGDLRLIKDLSQDGIPKEGRIMLSKGSEGRPALTFTNDANTGMYYELNGVSFTVYGERVFHINRNRAKFDKVVSIGKVEILSPMAQTLVDNQTTWETLEAFKDAQSAYDDEPVFEMGNYQSISFEYNINRESIGSEIGEIKIIINGTDITWEREKSTINDPGVDFFPEMENGLVKLKYKTTAEGVSARIRYIVKRWPFEEGNN